MQVFPRGQDSLTSGFLQQPDHQDIQRLLPLLQGGQGR